MTPVVDPVLLVVTTLPDPASARGLAERLVTDRLAACASVLAGCRSIYRWQGTLEQADEVPVLLKTVTSRYAALEAAIREHHPYDLPEILAFPAAAGHAAYLAWVTAETAPLS